MKYISFFFFFPLMGNTDKSTFGQSMLAFFAENISRDVSPPSFFLIASYNNQVCGGRSRELYITEFKSELKQGFAMLVAFRACL